MTTGTAIETRRGQQAEIRIPGQKREQYRFAYYMPQPGVRYYTFLPVEDETPLNGEEYRVQGGMESRRN
ncbi:MAG: hypothetical protein ACOC5K_05145 [Chloroflexota bacterium]